MTKQKKLIIVFNFGIKNKLLLYYLAKKKDFS